MNIVHYTDQDKDALLDRGPMFDYMTRFSVKALHVFGQEDADRDLKIQTSIEDRF